MCRWYLRNHLQKYGGTPKSALTAYFLASANIFESGRAAERLAWARTWVLAEAVTSHFRHTGYECSFVVFPLRGLPARMIKVTFVCTHCRGTKDSTKNLEELIDIVSFDDDSSGSLRDAFFSLATAVEAVAHGMDCKGEPWIN
uniref:Uncharacterized protein n=1 Tax=Aegilops tauschii subsp. strangulata TaxID=200361 RepID=A0A453DBN4_AEGTS